MSGGALIVPVLTPSGTIHFASVTQAATANDVISALLEIGEVQDEILGGLGDSGWDLQKVTKERMGRAWEDSELDSLGHGACAVCDNRAYLQPSKKSLFDGCKYALIRTYSNCHEIGILSRDDRISRHLQTGQVRPSLDRHFSSFPLTSHLHSASLRLISLHPSLRVTFNFLRVPEIYDEFKWDMYLSRTMTVAEAITKVCEQLGLSKSLPGSGGNIDYAIEEEWLDSGSDGPCKLILFQQPVIRLTHWSSFDQTGQRY